MLQMTPLKGTPLKIVLTAMVVVLGLFSWMLSPILAIVVLIGIAGLLPIERRARTSLVIIGCLSIGLGAALATGDLPFSQIAALKLQGSPYQAAISCMVWLLIPVHTYIEQSFLLAIPYLKGVRRRCEAISCGMQKRGCWAKNAPCVYSGRQNRLCLLWWMQTSNSPQRPANHLSSTHRKQQGATTFKG